MTTSSISYVAAAAFTITLTGLTSSSTLLAGRESTAVDNSTELAIDYIIGGKFKTGATATLSNSQIEVWGYASYDGTTYSGGATGSDAALTFASEKTQLRLLERIICDTTAGHVYEWCSGSFANAFGGVMPKKFGVWVVHNTSPALDATAASHEIKYAAVHYTSA